MSNCLADFEVQDKRHSIDAVNLEFPIMTSNFLSYLLSIGSPKTEDCVEFKQSAEIVYEFTEKDKLTTNSVSMQHQNSSLPKFIR